MPPRVYLCRHKDCRRAKGFSDLEKLLGEHVQPVPCQDVCKGPVAGVEVDGRIEWFGKLRSKKLHQALVKALKKGRVPDRLWKRRSKKRRGKLKFKGKLRR